MIDFKEVVKDLEDARKSYEEEKKKIQSKGQKFVKDALKSFFDSYPKLALITWTQYTPYFNDGEPCEFGIGAFEIAVWKSADNIPVDYDFADIDYVMDANDEFIVGTEVYGKFTPRTVEREWGLPKEHKDLYNKIKVFSVFLEDNQDLALAVFGDHVKITATKDGLEVVEFDHD